jgi:hypothetical protein
VVAARTALAARVPESRRQNLRIPDWERLHGSRSPPEAWKTVALAPVPSGAAERELTQEETVASNKRIIYLFHMQAKTLLERTGCPETVLKDWVRRKVILPARPGAGAGIHAEYDEANAIALLVGLEMKGGAITVARYAEAFAQLHDWLRNHSSLSWPQYVAMMSPTAAVLRQAQKAFRADRLCIVVPLAPFCALLNRTSSGSYQVQRSLLGLQTVRRS